MDLQCISKASMTCHRCSLAAAIIVLPLYSHSGYCRDDSRQYITIPACPAAAASLGTLSQKRTKRGRLQCISRGFHPLDVWTVILSDSPWTAKRRSLRTRQIQPKYGDEQADAGRDCRTRLARPNFQAQTQTRKYSFSLFSLPLAGLATLLG